MELTNFTEQKKTRKPCKDAGLVYVSVRCWMLLDVQMVEAGPTTLPTYHPVIFMYC